MHSICVLARSSLKSIVLLHGDLEFHNSRLIRLFGNYLELTGQTKGSPKKYKLITLTQK